MLEDIIYQNFINEYNINGKNYSIVDFIDVHIDIDYDRINDFESFIPYIPKLTEIMKQEDMKINELYMNYAAVNTVREFVRKTLQNKVKKSIDKLTK